MGSYRSHSTNKLYVRDWFSSVAKPCGGDGLFATHLQDKYTRHPTLVANTLTTKL